MWYMFHVVVICLSNAFEILVTFSYGDFRREADYQLQEKGMGEGEALPPGIEKGGALGGRAKPLPPV